LPIGPFWVSILRLRVLDRETALNSSIISSTFEALAGQAAPQSGGALALINMLLPFIIIFVIFYLLVILPQKKQQKKHQEMLNALQKGDRVLTSSGLFGRIVEVRPTLFKVEISPKVVVSLQKSAVVSKVQEEEGETAEGKSENEQKAK